jgi:hypothetical protein
MRHAILRLLACAAILAAAPSSASAAPPASCAHKFVGTWVYPGGTTVVAPGGTAYPKCPMCVSTQAWTCQGNTYLFSNSGPPGQFSATLSADGRQLTGGGTVATRVGGARTAAAPTPAKQEQHAPAQQSPKQQPTRTGSRQQANCSDITGTKSGGKLNVNCKPGGQKITAAPPPQLKQQPQKPAGAPQTNAGSQSDTPSAAQQAALAGNIIDELGKVRSGQIPPQPITGASTPPPPDPAFDPKEADPYRAAPPPEAPRQGQPCTTYFRNMMNNFERNAALCLRDTRLMRSLTDMVEKSKSTVDDIKITRNSAPDLFTHFDELDPRWIKVGPNEWAPNCNLPLTVAAQSEAFWECARVYACGLRAAACGLERASRTKANQCPPISRQCLAENPVPQQMTADPTPPPYQKPDWTQPPPSPAPPHRKSTITGPSGPGGGISSGGVMSAQ